MRQGDGSDLLGVGNPRNAEIGIIYVEAADGRQEVLTAINTQEMTGRKQIAIVLEANHKAFRHPIDFDGLKNVRRGLKAQLLFVAPPGPGPANFARQRSFQVYSNLDGLKEALLSGDIASTGSGRMRSKPGKLLGGLSGRQEKSVAPQVQGNQLPPSVPYASSISAPLPGPKGQARQPLQVPEIDTAKINPTSQSASGGVGSMQASAGASALDEDADKLAPPDPNGGQTNQSLPMPIAQGSASSTGSTRAGGSKPLAPRGAIAFPSIQDTPTTTGKLGAADKGGNPAPDAQNVAGAQVVPPVGILGSLPAAQANPQPTPTISGQGPTADPATRPAPLSSKGLTSSVAAPDRVGSRPGGTSTLPPGGGGGATHAATGSGSTSGGGTGGGGFRNARSGGPRRRHWRRLLLVVLVFLSVGLLLAAYTASGKSLGSILSPQVTAQISLTPLSKLEQDQYVIVGLPSGTPDPAKNEVAAHVIQATSPTKQGTASATGSTPATKASGTLLFQNTGLSGVQLQGGTLTGSDGVAVDFGPIYVSPSVTASTIGTAAQAGVAGNIKAGDLDGTCCGYTTITVKNLSAFTGGQNAIPNSVITQEDITNAINQVEPDLTSEAQSNLQAQITSAERADADSLSCKPNVTTDHKASDRATKVTATVTVTCTEVVYDYQAAVQIATQNLSTKVAKDQALQGFELDGQIVVSPQSQQVVGANQEIAIDMEAQGLWVYQFTEAQEQALKHLVLSRSRQTALMLLQSSSGVAAAQITLSSGTTMPSSESAMTLTIQHLPGVQATSTPSNTSVPPASTMNPASSPGASTPLPGFTPGGS